MTSDVDAYPFTRGEDLEIRYRIDVIEPGVTIDGSTPLLITAKKISAKGDAPDDSEVVAINFAGAYLAASGGEPAYFVATATRLQTAAITAGTYIMDGWARIEGKDVHLGFATLIASRRVGAMAP